MESNGPPERIYLQWWGEEKPADGEVVSIGEVTWSYQPVHEHDVEYYCAPDPTALTAEEMLEAGIWVAQGEKYEDDEKYYDGEGAEEADEIEKRELRRMILDRARQLRAEGQERVDGDD